MNTNRDEALLFASETSIFRIASIAKVVSWVVLVFYLISFANDINGIIRGGMQWPTQVSQWPLLIANIFFAPAIGLFYFLVLQGLAQALNLGLDIFYELQPDESPDVEELP